MSKRRTEDEIQKQPPRRVKKERMAIADIDLTFKNARYDKIRDKNKGFQWIKLKKNL